MLIWNQSKLTTAGKALLAKAQADRRLSRLQKYRLDQEAILQGKTWKAEQR